jgi:hypothetical protein
LEIVLQWLIILVLSEKVQDTLAFAITFSN